MLTLQWIGLDIEFSGHAFGRKSTKNRCVWEGEGVGGVCAVLGSEWAMCDCALGRGPPQSVK